MDEISISKFKATCLAVLEKVRATGEPIRVTKFGRPIAEIRAPSSQVKSSRQPLERPMGFLADAFEITGDIVNTSDLWPVDGTLMSWDRQNTSRRVGAKSTSATKAGRLSRSARKTRS